MPVFTLASPLYYSRFLKNPQWSPRNIFFTSPPADTILALVQRQFTGENALRTAEKQKHREENTMFRLWGKMWKHNRLLKDTVIADDSEDTRTHKIFRALEEICYQFDLENPIWLDSNITDFKRHARTRFSRDSFIEQIDFDYLEIQVIEED